MVVDHPLVQHKLSQLRDRDTRPQEFRQAMAEIAALMVYEATRDFETKPKTIHTPLARTRGSELKRDVVLVPILRAGLGLLDPFLRIIPHAQVGFIGLKRDEATLESHFYHQSLPKNLGRFEVIVVDPMLATGGSTLAALKLIFGMQAKRVRIVNVLSAPEGIQAVHAVYPQLDMFTAAIDRKLTSIGYITPGLGDAGDRLFGPG